MIQQKKEKRKNWRSKLVKYLRKAKAIFFFYMRNVKSKGVADNWSEGEEEETDEGDRRPAKKCEGLNSEGSRAQGREGGDSIIFFSFFFPFFLIEIGLAR